MAASLGGGGGGGGGGGSKTIMESSVAKNTPS